MEPSVPKNFLFVFIYLIFTSEKPLSDQFFKKNKFFLVWHIF